MNLEVAGAALLLALTAFLLRGFGWRGAPIFAAVSVVVLMVESGAVFGYIFGSLEKIGEQFDISEPVGVAVKILGVGYLFGVCADICRELSEVGIAKAVEVLGRVEIIALVIPYFEEIIRVGVELIG